MDYFNIPMSPLVNIALLIFALIMVGVLYFNFSYNRKKILYDVVELEALPRNKLWIRPTSIKQGIDVLFRYIFLLWICIFFLLWYVATHNIMALISPSGL